MKHLFAYGSLTDPDEMEKVSHCIAYHEKAVLRGYAVYPVKGTAHKGVMLEDNMMVEGRLYHAVPRAVWARLDRYAGENYVRDTVIVENKQHSIFEAEVYVVKTESLIMLDVPLMKLPPYVRENFVPPAGPSF
jgi:gamma-glutamylcyclotransferase (GGCT)/AIG2-like uncharacterized protein YtfP